MPKPTVPAAGPGLPMSINELTDRLNAIADRMSVVGMAVLGIQHGSCVGDHSALATLAFDCQRDVLNIIETVDCNRGASDD